MSQLAERIAQFRKMATEDPDNDLGHFRLGQLLMEDNQFAEAAKSFERTAEINPHFSKVYQLLGECLIKLDQKPRAVEVLTTGWKVCRRASARARCLSAACTIWRRCGCRTARPTSNSPTRWSRR